MAHIPTIVVVGSSNADMVVATDHLPTPGETVIGGTFSMNAGGKGANQACAAARLGASVHFIAKLGSDVFADRALELLDNFSVGVSHVSHDGETSTGIALIVVDRHGENAIAVAPGANHSLSPRDIDKAEDVLSIADLVVCQYEIPAATVLHLIDTCHRLDRTLLINPAPADAITIPREAYRHIGILVPNQGEAGLLLDREIRKVDDAMQAAIDLLDWGPHTVIVTLGAAGSVAATRHGDRLVAPGYAIEAVDSTGAGDCFIGALAAELASGSLLEEALRFANVAGALSVTRPGAVGALPFRHEVQEFIDLL